MTEGPTPIGIEQAGPDALRIRWKDGHESVYPVRSIRLACRCAHCIEEVTGRPLLREEDVPADVKPVEIAPVGRYALQFSWTDGHDTGIFPFDLLRDLCPCCNSAGN